MSNNNDYKYDAPLSHGGSGSKPLPCIPPLAPKVGPPIGTGVKHDSGKPDLSLLSTIATFKVAQVMTFGKQKYSAHNWRGAFAWSRPAAAALRHIFLWLGGEDKDPESGLSHLAHAACCLMFLLEFEDTHPEFDDRYKASK